MIEATPVPFCVFSQGSKARADGPERALNATIFGRE